MKSIEIYDPAMCCSSGVCGPAPDETLAAFAGALQKVKTAGVAVSRRSLSHEPLAFANNPEVKATLEKEGEAGLPLIFIDGELSFRGVYPSYAQLARVLGLDEAAEASCCGDDDACCSSEPKTQAASFVKVDEPQAMGSRCCDPKSGCC